MDAQNRSNATVSEDSLSVIENSLLTLKSNSERHNLFESSNALIEGDHQIEETESSGSADGVPPKLIVLCTNPKFTEDSFVSLLAEDADTDADCNAGILKKIVAIEDINRATENEVETTNQVLVSTSPSIHFKSTLPPYSSTNEPTNQAEFNFNITPPASRPVVLYSAPPLHGAPPTYSATMRIGPPEIERPPYRLFGRRANPRLEPSPPFIAPIPPPSYAESQGLSPTQQRPTVPSPILEVDDIVWGAEPTSAVCPNCRNFVITNVHTRRSNLTHFTALTLCVCGCWPCCLLPYCIRSCKTIYHECPVCSTVIGIYNPW